MQTDLFESIDDMPIVDQSLMVPEHKLEGLSPTEQICMIRYGTKCPIIETTDQPTGICSPVDFFEMQEIIDKKELIKKEKYRRKK